MANRTVNVNIKYKVDTVDVQKAAAASLAAQKATDQLRKAADDYGKAAIKAGKDVSSSLKATNKDVSSLAGGFSELYASVKTVFAAGIAKEVIDITLNMAKLSGQVEGVTRAFNRLPNATLLLDDLRKSTHGTVTDLELMQKTLMASNYKIPLQNMGKLLEFAATKAQQTGQEVNHLVEYIVTGIGLRSVRRLDDLGFTASRLKEALGGVSVQAASMGQITDAVTTLMTEDLQKLGGFAETTATQVERISTKWEKLKLTISQALTSPGLLRFYEKTIDILSVGANVILNGSDKATADEAKQKAVEDVNNFKQMQLTKEVLKNKQETLDVVQQELNTRTQLIGRNNDELKQLRERLDIINKMYSGEISNEEARKKLYGDRFNLEGKDLNQRRLINIEFSKEIENEKERISEQYGFYKFKNIQLKESIRILKEYLKSLQQVDEIEKPKGEGQGDGRRGFLMKDLRGTAKKEDVLKDFGVPLSSSKPTGEINLPITPYLPKDFADKLEDAFNERKDEIVNVGVNLFEQLIMSGEEAEIASLNRRMQYIQDFYDEQIILAGDNERYKKELSVKAEREASVLRNQIAEKEWKMRRNGVILDTAAGIVKAFATMPTPAAIVESGIIALIGATQLSVISSNKPRGFAKGVLDLKGPGTTTSDSIPAMLSRGESVMTAEETRRSFGLLEAIKSNKIDDKILKNIDFSGGKSVSFNDDRIVKVLSKIESKRQPDLIVQGKLLYQYITDSNGNKTKIRSKSI